MTIEKIRIRDLLSRKINGEWGNDKSSSDGVKVLRTTNFTNTGKIDYANIVERDIEKSLVENKKVLYGDIIIEKSGGSPNQPVGRVVYFDYEGDEIFLCNNFTTILRTNEKIYNKYFFYHLFFNHITKRTLKYQNKTTGIINLQLERYLDEIILLPDKIIQQKIVAILDKADGLRRKRQQAMGLLDEFLRSTFLEMFGDPVKNPRGWEKRPLEKIGMILTGNTPPRSKSDFYGDYIEWIKSDNINTNDFYLTKAREYLSKKGKTVGRVVPPGSILVTCIAGSKDCIGNVAIADREVAFNQQINAIVPNESVKSKFLFAQFLYSKKLVQSYATDSMKGLLIKSKFNKINFICPPLHIQNQFTVIFESVERTRERMQKSLEEMENLFNSLMQRAFKGELQLNENGDETR